MNIYQVRDNLKNTIAGKEKYLAECNDALDKGITSTGVHIAVNTTKEFLEINIAELQRILVDVEVCCEQYSEMGWMINSERMGQ